MYYNNVLDLFLAFVFNVKTFVWCFDINFFNMKYDLWYNAFVQCK